VLQDFRGDADFLTGFVTGLADKVMVIAFIFGE